MLDRFVYSSLRASFSVWISSVRAIFSARICFFTNANSTVNGIIFEPSAVAKVSNNGCGSITINFTTWFYNPRINEVLI